jgi:hypothetical protein
MMSKRTFRLLNLLLWVPYGVLGFTFYAHAPSIRVASIQCSISTPVPGEINCITLG